MSQPALEQALGKLVMDAAFREAFFCDPERACRQAGIELSAGERDTLAGVRPGALAAFRDYLDRKWSMSRG